MCLTGDDDRGEDAMSCRGLRQLVKGGIPLPPRLAVHRKCPGTKKDCLQAYFDEFGQLEHRDAGPLRQIVSADSRSSSTWRVSSTGTWVNRLVTLKLTKRSRASSFMTLILSTNAEEFFTECGVLPVRAVRILISSSARL